MSLMVEIVEKVSGNKQEKLELPFLSEKVFRLKKIRLTRFPDIVI